MPVIATVLTSKKVSRESDLQRGVCSWMYHPAGGENLTGKQGCLKAEIPRFRLLSDVITKLPEDEQLLLGGWLGRSWQVPSLWLKGAVIVHLAMQCPQSLPGEAPAFILMVQDLG